MTSLFPLALSLVLAFVMVLGIVVAMFVLAWWLVYHWIGCRKAPIQKSVLLSIGFIWVASAAVLALL